MAGLPKDLMSFGVSGFFIYSDEEGGAICIPRLLLDRC